MKPGLTHRSPIDLNQFPDSPYAQELRMGVSRLRFAPPLEAAYRRLHLERAQVRARAWSVLTACLVVVFTLLQVRAHGALHPVSLLHFVLAPAVFALAWIPWSRYYQTHYLPIAEIVLPLFAGVTAPLSAQAAAEGRYEVLIQLALQIVGIFEFTGLLYRRALLACILLVTGFAIGTIIWALPPDAALKYVGTMALATFMGAVAFRGAEVIARTQFLEARLLEELLERDPLTGLKNRRSFDEYLQRVWTQAQSDGRRVAVLMVDVDDFKRFNDLYGHQAGDEALRRVGAVLRQACRRPFDLSARYGGEEFALILHDVSIEYAREVAEQVRTAVASLSIPHAAASAAPIVTLSVGVAVVEPVAGRAAGGVVQLADEALYAAKAAGRNGIVVRGSDAYRELDTGVFAQPVEITPGATAASTQKQ